LLIVYATKTKQTGKSCAGWDIEDNTYCTCSANILKKKQQHPFKFFKIKFLMKFFAGYRKKFLSLPPEI